ncbi:uncharacterized protein [Temnothorax nylanderi]|uniref:uncharacterized protein n=1 Tax=Temnothorax nylanderi TaxID=102681 RepID=UPI003A8C5472
MRSVATQTAAEGNDAAIQTVPAAGGVGVQVDLEMRTPSPDLSALLQLILTKIDELDKKFADRLDKSDKKFTAAFEKFDRKITALIGCQEAVNADFASKHNQIPDVIASHGERIAALEAQSSRLLGSLSVDSESSAASRVPRTSNIIISGIPCSFAKTSAGLVTSVFCALGVPQLVFDVLETRDVAGRDASRARDAASGSVSAIDQADTAGRKRSIIVALKSCEIRDYILKAKRGKPRLTVNDVFSTSIPGNIYVNELLPSLTYKLFRQTRVRARQLSFKHVWCRDGRIFVRKDQGLPPISITSEADLTELQ